jgi:hypothetical protein
MLYSERRIAMLSHLFRLHVLVIALLGSCLQGTPIVLGVNGIVNGDAEGGTGSSDGSILPVPGWTVTGNFTAVQYDAVGFGGVFPTSADPGPVDRGMNFFAGGPSNASSTAIQVLDVSNIAGQIDGGLITFLLSGYLGGFASQRDNAVLTASFLDASNVSIGTATIGPVTPSDRANLSGLLLRTTAGTIPGGTRGIEFGLQMTRLDGSYNDGYADNLSFIATDTSVPEPTTLGMLGLGVLVLVSRRWMRS